MLVAAYPDDASHMSVTFTGSERHDFMKNTRSGLAFLSICFFSLTMQVFPACGEDPPPPPTMASKTSLATQWAKSVMTGR